MSKDTVRCESIRVLTLLLLFLQGHLIAFSDAASDKLFWSVSKGEASEEQLARAIELVCEEPIKNAQLARKLPQYGCSAHAVIPALVDQINQLEEGDWHVRSNFATILGEFGSASVEAVPRLIEIMLGDGHGAMTAEQALGRIGESRAIPALLNRLESKESGHRWTAEALSKFPDDTLERYCRVERAAWVELRMPPDTQISTRERLSQKMYASYMGHIRINGKDYQVAFPDYRMPHDELVYVVKPPDQAVSRLTINYSQGKLPRDIPLALGDSFSFAENWPEDTKTWAQSDLPDFSQEGIYTFWLEGVFTDKAADRPPLSFRSNEVSFEVSSRFQSEAEKAAIAAEKAAIAREKFEEENPQGWVTVHGSVNSPGRFGYHEGMRLSDAIKEARGPTRLSNPRHIRLVRGEGEKKVISTYDYRPIHRGEETATDPLLETYDVIYVPENCLVAGSLVATPCGSKPIEDLVVGDSVLGYDTTSGAIVSIQVLKISESHADQYLKINSRLKVTEEHPVYTDGEWHPASGITVGMELLNLQALPETVNTIEEITAEVRVYDISVETPHNFFADGILVHNKI